MYYTSLAAAKLWFGSCQTRVWQLPNSGLAAGQPPKSGFLMNLSIACSAISAC